MTTTALDGQSLLRQQCSIPKWRTSLGTGAASNASYASYAGNATINMNGEYKSYSSVQVSRSDATGTGTTTKVRYEDSNGNRFERQYDGDVDTDRILGDVKSGRRKYVLE
jgi:hypothetical protein